MAVAILMRMNTSEAPRPGSAAKMPPSITTAELMRHLGAGEKIHLVDVREPAPFGVRHIAGSLNAPDSQTTALVKKLQTLGKAVLLCQDGRQSAMVVRTLGFCGFRTLAFLEGGISAWAAAGGKLAETTRTEGFERELPREPEPPSAPPPRPGLLAALKGILHRETK
ncbi:MAG: rhodanese-like domain-containing protein [Planctomycetes bacterium]|nr:rhodanese-like domain-containing protein [Planctomycetota bacterium]